MVPRSLCPSRAPRKKSRLRSDVRDLKICEDHGPKKDDCVYALLLGQSRSRSPNLSKDWRQDRGRIPPARQNVTFVSSRKMMQFHSGPRYWVDNSFRYLVAHLLETSHTC